MGRLLIDYSKNTAPLQPSSGDDQEFGMSLKYHVPDEEMSSSLKSLAELNFNPPRSPRPPQGGTAKNEMRAIYPLQQASVFDSRKMPGPDFQQQNSKSKKAQRSLSPRRQRTNEKATTRTGSAGDKMITFRLPKTSRVITTQRNGRFKGKLHYSDSDLFGWADVNDNMSTSNQTTQTTAAKRTDTNNSKDDASLSVCTAPAKVSSAKMKLMTSGSSRNSITESIKEEHKDEIDALLEAESDHEEEEPQSSFLPAGLSGGKDRSPSPHPDKKKKRGKKKKNKTTLDEWFGKGGQEEGGEGDAEEPTKEAAKKKAELDDVSIALSQMSESYPMGPEARKRMLPKRSLSFEDVGRGVSGSHRSLVSASTNTRRGGRKPGNRSKTNINEDDATAETNATSSTRFKPRRGVGRTKSFDGSVTPMSSSRGDLMRNNNSSYSFMAGSRIRVRTLGGPAGSDRSLLGGSMDSSTKNLYSSFESNSSKNLLGSMSNSNDDDESVASQTPSTASPRRRRLPGRSRTCESLTRMRV